jgi:hypothetical protein
MATDEQQPAPTTGAAAVSATSAVPLGNGTHTASQPDAADKKSPTLAYDVQISESAAASTAVYSDGAPTEAMNGDAAADAAPQPDSLLVVAQQLTEISLSQDLDSGSGAAGALDPRISSTDG